MVPRNEPVFQPQNVRPHLPRQISASHYSLISPTPSVEGDDEDSAGDDDFYYQDYERDLLTRRRYSTMPEAKYEEEDTRPTSQKETNGFYAFSIAAEPFAISAIGSFLPITLEQLARDNGYLLKDKTTPCKAAWPPASSLLNVFSAPKRHEVPACVVKIGGHWEINTASFALYTFSISVFVQTIVVLSMSGASDHGRYRKTFLLAFAYIGAMSLILFLPTPSSLYLLSALLAIISNTCFGASFVLLNSFIPILVRNHPVIAEYAHDANEEAPLLNHRDEHYHYDSADDAHTSGSTLLPRDQPDTTRPLPPSPSLVSEELQLATRISSNGIGFGYIAGLIVQMTAVFIIVSTGNTTLSLRLCLALIGVWWAVFSIPAALWLRPRPGPPLPANMSTHADWLAYIIYAWTALFKTIAQAKKLKDMMIFLAAWFLLSDSIATVSGTAVLFAKTNLGMSTQSLALISVIGTIAGVIGAFYWSTFSRLLNLRASQTIIACVCLFELIPLYGLLGFIPAVQRLGFLGLQQPLEIYFLGAIYGFVLGGLSSYCRAFFGELIPPGFEASFYALYAITDKGSSIFGPAVVGAITDRYGDIRPAFVFLAVLVAAPLPLLVLVDAERGKRDAKIMAMELEGRKVNDDGAEERSSVPRITLTESDD